MSSPRPLALQLYTLREAMETDWSGVLEKLAEIGYLGVEPAGFSFATAAEFKSRCDRLGLKIVAAHAGLPLGEQQKAVLEIMADLDCQRLICAGTGHDKFGTIGDIKERATLFNEANVVARANGLLFGLHNHYWEFGSVDGRLAFDILLDDLDSDIFFEIDAYWAQAAGVDAADLLTRLGARAPILHIKDGSTQIEDAMVAVGAGVMDFHKVIPASAGVEWLVVELDRCDGDMMTAVIDSYHYLTSQELGRGRR